MPSPGAPIPEGRDQAGKTKSIRHRVHLLACWLDRPAGRNWLNILLFAATAGTACLFLGRPSRHWHWNHKVLGALFIGLPLAGLLLSLRSLVGPKITFYARRCWRDLLESPADSTASVSTDQPIRELKEDRLGFDRYAAVLARRIIDPEEPTPMTIGIHGPWGSGKTSMIRLIQRYLDRTCSSEDLKRFDQTPLDGDRRFSKAWPESHPSDRLTVINFNAWQYGDAQFLWRALVLALIEKQRELGLP